MKTIELQGNTYKIEGRFSNGNFYLSGPRGGNVHYAKELGEGFVFYPNRPGAAPLKDERGIYITATLEQLTN